MTPFPDNDLNAIRLQIKNMDDNVARINKIVTSLTAEQATIYQMGVVTQTASNVATAMRTFVFEMERLEKMVGE